MSNRFSTFIKKKVVRKNQNLVSLEEPFQALERMLRGRQIHGILDAGASNASVSLRLLRHFPAATVYGFEPNPSYRDKLLAIAMEEPRFVPEFLALSDHSGTAELVITASPGISSLLEPNKRVADYDERGATVSRRETVPMVTIDDWASERGVQIELMKFDIQGAELKALQGAVKTLQTTVLMLFIEVWFNPAYEGGALFSEIDLFLRQQGFVLHDIFQPKYHPKGPLFWGNAVYSHAERMGV